jgi:hypothetical protein
MLLEELCEVRLAFVHIAQVNPLPDGAIYGTGDGSATGERLSGTVRWTNHPGMRSDGTTLPDVHGVIETEDGANVLFDLHGVSTLIGEGPGRDTRVAGGFTAEHERYRWLNDELCVGEGAFDMETRSLRMRVYRCVNELT